MRSGGTDGIIVENGGMYMRDFPFFTTEYGVSGLVLKEIPYKETAYIQIRDVQNEYFGENLAECVSFCRMCGAEKIYAAGHEMLEKYPLYTEVIQMRGTVSEDGQKVKSLFPVTQKTVSQWRTIYNKRMGGVDNAATLESRDEKRILESGGAYFVHEDGKVLGIGWLEDNRILAIAAVEKGAGEAVMHTLLSLIREESAIVEVASTNIAAIRLYEKLGFVKTALIASWYRVWPV